LLVSGPNAEEIAEAIKRVLRDVELAKRLRTAGRARIEQAFSADKMVEAMIAVYESVRS